jgi:DNA repair exonuclease SbcCD ATPase subunit
MIKTIQISNFQSHKNTILELSEGVNVIKGRSHSGKSSIIRALDWALLNRIRGDYFVSHFRGKKEETAVRIEFTDESYIVRKKGSSVNGYELSVGGDIEAIRTDLPEEVQSITRMDKINVQGQDELYYMLKETPGYVAKELNKLVGLDIIDETLTRLNKIENENTIKLKLLEKDSIEVKENLKELDYLDDFEKRVIEIENMWDEHQRLSRKREKLSELSNDIITLGSVIEETSEWLSIKAPVDELLQLIEEQSQLQSSSSKLSSAYASMQQQEIVRETSAQRVKTREKRIAELLKQHADEFCRYCGAHLSHWRKE